MPIKLTLLFLIMFFSSCASRCVETHGRASLHVESDSLARTTRLAIRTSAVPESHAALQIPAADLRALPPAAAYTAKGGQATVRFLHDTLFITASCDSLQQLIYEYEQEVTRLSQLQTNHSETETKTSGLLLYIIGIAMSLLFAGLLWAKRIL